MSDKNTNELDDHMTNAIFGPRKTNPDERRKFLGSLRERVALRISNVQLRDAHTVLRFKAVIAEYKDKDYSVLINGHVGTGTTGPFVKVCAQNDIPFTLVSDESAQLDDDATGLLVVAKQAIFKDNIDLPAEAKPAEKKKHHLFGLF
ncbi:YueI family protein [Lacticaseibacillus hulanensis]|uniref:YueI family protein n=1 Tax=Lacticaseibacillus hulanensis TaxID=2493111 RepID=UPI000FDA40DA|nr:YueI family protein [Lacticaseibacillus hulanensis]